MKKFISILGSTGSVGLIALKIIQKKKKKKKKKKKATSNHIYFQQTKTIRLFAIK